MVFEVLKKYLYVYFVCVCVYAQAYTAQHVCGGRVEVREQISGTDFALLSRGLWGWHSRHQLWYEECLLAEPSCWLKTLLHFKRQNCID